MTSRRVFTIVGLCALAALALSCTRSDVNVPSPVGPSTLSVTFDLEATPNVILATADRSMTTVRATVRKNGAAMPNVAVYFKILSGPGEFSNYSDQIAAATDSTGVANVVFIGPSMYEISRDTTTAIQGQMQTSTPTFIFKTVEIRIIRGSD